MKKRFLTTVFTLALGLSLLITSHASATSTEFKRLWGNNRYQTCSAIVNEGWSSSDYAVIVNGENFPDALSASTLAKKYNAPILLTENTQLNSNAYEQLKRLNVKQVFIVGGDSVVKPDVENTINGLGIKSTRYKGMNRTETSIAVANQIGVQNGIILTTDSDFTDALSVSPIAAKLQIPIILMPKDSVPNSVSNFIVNKNISKTYVLGGTDLISDFVASQFPNVQRIGGNDKYERNINIINTFANDFNFNSAYLASSEKFADALSGSALAALNGNPIILTGDTPASVTKNFALNKKLFNLNVLGGTGVIADDIIDKIKNYDIKDTSNSKISSSSNVVAFVDKNLEKKVRQQIKKPSGDILKSDVENVKTLYFTNLESDSKEKIRNISGLENFTDLTELSLDGNEISNIEPLKGLTKLTKLYLSYDSISDIEPISELTNLTELYLGYNSISNIEPIKGLHNLKKLGLWNNQISNIEPLKDLTNLTGLTLSNDSISNEDLSNGRTPYNNSISNLEPLRGLTNLTELYLDYNPISNIEPLKGLTNLKFLDITCCPLSDIEPLKGLTNLTSLCLFNNKINDIEPLKGLTKLVSLRIMNNEITSIEPLRGLPGVRDLLLSGNPITDYSPVSSYYQALQHPDFTLP